MKSELKSSAPAELFALPKTKKLENKDKISQEYWCVKGKITSFLLICIDKNKNLR